MKYVFPLLALVVLIGGCTPPPPLHPPDVFRAPDLAIYRGVYFESRDGMKTFESIVILPAQLRDPVPLLLTDGSSIDVREVSADVLRAHGVEITVSGDDGHGNYDLISSGYGGMFAKFRSRIPEYIAIFSDFRNPHPFPITIQGKQVSVPIARDELEALLGPPDEIKLDTSPGG